MKAIEIKNQSLVLCERDIPVPKEGEILVEVKAAGVNRPDILQRMGMYPPPKGITDIPGLEISGIVIEGSGAFKEGDEICALLAGGGYAEYAVVPVEQCLLKPKNISFEEGACLAEALFTIQNTLIERGQIKKDQNILIHGGSSGIGSFAIQIASAWGCHVYTTAGSAEKCEACIEFGAALAVNYKKEDFEEVLEDIKIDVVLDMVGGSYINKNIKLMNENGRLVHIAFLEGKRAPIDIQKIMQKRLVLTGATLRNAPVSEKGLLRDAIKEKLWPWVEQDVIKVSIDSEFPLKDAWKAHVRMESSKHIGKIVLTM